MGNNILYISIYIIITTISFNTSFVTSKFVTQTVYGFLDFTTTIGSTVMVFSPESAPTLNFKETKIEAVKVIETKPIKDYGKEVDAFINPTKLLINNSSMSETVKFSLPMKIKTHSEFVMSKHKNGEMENNVAYIESNLYKPEYNLLSRQPTEYVEETFKLVNINPNLRNNKFRFSSSRICGIDNSKEINAPGNGITSTCISSKYIQNTLNPLKNMKAKISSTLTPRILKTAVPLALTGSNEDIQGYRQPGLSKKVQTRNFSSSLETTAFSQKTTERTTTTQGKHRKSPNRSKSKRRNKHSRNSESEKRTLRTQSPIEDGRRSYRQKTHISTTTETDTASSIFMLKLNRTPGRWQYKTSPKPKINIRKPVSGNNVSSVYTTTTFSTDLWRNDNIVKNSSNVDLESSGSQSGAIINKENFEDNQKFLVETLNIEISTPVDFQNVYYEIATIKTPYTFQAGVVKKTRYITVTSTFQKTLEPEVSTSAVFEGPLTENILITSVNADELQLDGSITTLLPLSLTDNEETPRLEVTTDSYTFTKKKFATKVLPIVRENATSYVTAVQTYEIKNIITVTKTLLPHDTNEFIASRNLKDFNINLDEAGSEINFDLEFADEDNLENVKEDKLDSIHFAKNNTSSIVPTSHLNQNSLINIFNSISQNPTLFTNHTVVKLHTLWESHILPVINGLSTTYRTISKSVGIIDRTEYELNTIHSSVEPQISVNPFLLPAPQQFQTITSPLLQQTYVTETSSKVLKLTFGAKTAYTTLFSTQVLPKIVTSFVTTSIPVQATVAYPGYYPPPYAPFPYVG